MKLQLIQQIQQIQPTRLPQTQQTKKRISQKIKQKTFRMEQYKYRVTEVLIMKRIIQIQI